ncbi:MAG: carboxynorspermidine decarboxylase [Candidatus Nomurabacteria bacterium]|nr:carboxynorspermidine decarboxylase [Candidatus Nomurabacteria bacterium]
MNTESKFIEPWVTEEGWKADDFKKVPTPCYVVSEAHLEKNFKILNQVEKDTGVHILMALKGFSMFSTFPLAKKYLSGSEASSVNEARLGREKFGKEMHVFSPSYTKENLKEYLKYADHLVFNSFSQWDAFKGTIKKFNKSSKKKVSCGMRVNLEHSEAEVSMYNPSAPNSHFGVTLKEFKKDNLEGLEGLHFHNLCELDADALVRSLKVFEQKFGEFLPKMKWVNFGGGHHITRDNYNLELLKKALTDFKSRYPHLTVYMEPGEATALNAGVLVGSVVDILKNEMDIAVLDISPTCHMPDVLEIPYLPRVIGVDFAKEVSKNVYRLVGPTCLTGDVIGDYSFNSPLKIGDRVVFLNMAIYTMVKNNTFNGVDLPSIAIQDKKGKIKVIKKFGYKDFKERLS